MSKIRSSQALINFAEASDSRLLNLRNKLIDEGVEWENLLHDDLENRLTTSARAKGIPESVVGEYVGSIVASIDRIRSAMVAAADDLKNISSNMGSVAHCASVLRHKADQAANGQGSGGFVL
jgi:hypothetical protein